MTAFLERAGSGVSGDITRPLVSIIESGIFNKNAATLPTAFGIPVKIVSGEFEVIAAGDAAAVFYGVLTRMAPSRAPDLNESFGTGSPNLENIQGILTEGYINVIATVGTPSRGQPVYMRIQPAVGQFVGDFETALIVGQTVELAGVVWGVDGKDASNVTELKIK